MIIGIDLGTTNSLVAFLGEDGPQIISNVMGDSLTPSVVGVDLDGTMLVGKPAKELQVSHPTRCASVFKRKMGTDWSVVLGEGESTRRFTAVELSSVVLTCLKHDAEAFLKQQISDVVITVPAYFNELQRQATIQAGELAGFSVRRIINEPTAAAIAYGLNDSQTERVSLVFDLGGGTFDVSIIDQFDSTLEIRASAGETFLGGEDFTNAMVSRILKARGENFEHVELQYPALISRLRAECENGKRQLAKDETVDIRIPDNAGNLPEDGDVATLTREEFEEWTRQLLSRVEGPIRRSLGDSGLQRAEIDSLILVGGATRMRCVVECVTELFGKSPQCDLSPDHVVAMGAAIQAGLVGRNESLGDIVVTDVAPFTLGVEIARNMAGKNHGGYFQPIISRNTTIPVSRVERFATLETNQNQVEVRLYQGEGRKVDDNLLLGSFVVRGIPPGPVGQPIDLRFTYDLNGILEVEATIVESGLTIKHVVTNHAHGLSKKQIEAAVIAMEKLKTHPRELTQNRYLLKRAERLYSELPQSERDTLDLLLTGFEESLEMQDPEAIEIHRTALQQYLSAFDVFPTDEESE